MAKRRFDDILNDLTSGNVSIPNSTVMPTPRGNKGVASIGKGPESFTFPKATEWPTDDGGRDIIKKRIDSLDDNLEGDISDEDKNRIRNSIPQPKQTTMDKVEHFLFGETTSKNIHNEKINEAINEARTSRFAARTVVGEARDLINATTGEHGRFGFFNGLKSGVDIADLATAGINSATNKKSQSFATKNIEKKVNAGIPLSKDEQLFVDAIGLRSKADEIVAKEGGTTVGYGVGNTIGQMPVFVEQIALTSPVGGEVGTALKGVSWIAKGIKSGAPLWRKGLTLAGIELGKASVVTPLQPMFASAFADQELKQYSITRDESGDVVAERSNPQSVGTSLAKAFAQTLTENWSEGMGEVFGKAGAKMVQGIAKSKLGVRMAGSQLGSTIAKANDLIQKTTGRIGATADDFGLGGVRAFTKDVMKWHGTLDEIAEEEFNNVVQPLLMGEPDQLKQLVDPKQQLITALSCAVAGVGFKAIEIPGYVQSGIAINQNKKAYQQNIANLRPDIASQVVSAFGEQDIEARGSALASLPWAQMQPAEREQVVNAVWHRTRYDFLRGAKAASDAEQALNDISSRTESVMFRGNETSPVEGGSLYTTTLNNGVGAILLDGDIVTTIDADGNTVHYTAPNGRKPVVVTEDGRRLMVDHTELNGLSMVPRSEFVSQGIDAWMQQQDAEEEQQDAQDADEDMQAARLQPTLPDTANAQPSVQEVEAQPKDQAQPAVNPSHYTPKVGDTVQTPSGIIGDVVQASIDHTVVSYIDENGEEQIELLGPHDELQRYTEDELQDSAQADSIQPLEHQVNASAELDSQQAAPAQAEREEAEPQAGQKVFNHHTGKLWTVKGYSNGVTTLSDDESGFTVSTDLSKRPEYQLMPQDNGSSHVLSTDVNKETERVSSDLQHVADVGNSTSTEAADIANVGEPLAEAGNSDGLQEATVSNSETAAEPSSQGQEDDATALEVNSVQQPGPTVHAELAKEIASTVNDEPSMEAPYYVSKNRKYLYTIKDGNLIILDRNGVEIPSHVNGEANQQHTRLAKEYKEAFDYSKGEIGVAEDASSEAETLSMVIRSSRNPLQLAGIYLQETARGNEMVKDAETSVVGVILEIAQGHRVSKAGFDEWADPNLTTGTIAKTYFSKDGLNPSDIAALVNAELHGEWNASDMVTADDVVQTILSYPRGIQDLSRQIKDGTHAKEAYDAFAALTGFDITPSVSEKVKALIQNTTPRTATAEELERQMADDEWMHRVEVAEQMGIDMAAEKDAAFLPPASKQSNENNVQQNLYKPSQEYGIQATGQAEGDATGGPAVSNNLHDTNGVGNTIQQHVEEAGDSRRGGEETNSSHAGEGQENRSERTDEDTNARGVGVALSLTQQAEYDRRKAELSTEIADLTQRLSAARKAKDKAINEAQLRNGLFGDTAADPRQATIDGGTTLDVLSGVNTITKQHDEEITGISKLLKARTNELKRLERYIASQQKLFSQENTTPQQELNVQNHTTSTTEPPIEGQQENFDVQKHTASSEGYSDRAIMRFAYAASNARKQLKQYRLEKDNPQYKKAKSDFDINHAHLVDEFAKKITTTAGDNPTLEQITEVVHTTPFSGVESGPIVIALAERFGAELPVFDKTKRIISDAAESVKETSAAVKEAKQRIAKAANRVDEIHTVMQHVDGTAEQAKAEAIQPLVEQWSEADNHKQEAVGVLVQARRIESELPKLVEELSSIGTSSENGWSIQQAKEFVAKLKEKYPKTAPIEVVEDLADVVQYLKENGYSEYMVNMVQEVNDFYGVTLPDGRIIVRVDAPELHLSAVWMHEQTHSLIIRSLGYKKRRALGEAVCNAVGAFEILNSIGEGYENSPTWLLGEEYLCHLAEMTIKNGGVTTAPASVEQLYGWINSGMNAEDVNAIVSTFVAQILKPESNDNTGQGYGTHIGDRANDADALQQDDNEGGLREVSSNDKRRSEPAGGIQEGSSNQEKVAAAEEQTDTDPSEAQKQAGNYRKGKARVMGMEISIENPQGSTRSGVDPNGKAWNITMPQPYGYILGTVGKDKDHIDVYLGKNLTKDTPVFIVNQVDPSTGKLDEHKVMLGYPTYGAAKRAYMSAYEDGWNGFGSMGQMSLDEFKEWAYNGNTKAAVKAVEPTAELHDSQEFHNAWHDDDFMGVPREENGVVAFSKVVAKKSDNVIQHKFSPNWWRERMQDSTLRVRILQNTLVKDGGLIPFAANAWEAANRFTSIANAKMDYFEKEELANLLNVAGSICSKVNADWDSFGDYLMCKHGVERQETGGVQVFSEDPNDDWTLANAKRTVEEFESKVSPEDITQLWEAVGAATRASLKALVDGGVISQKDMDRYLSRPGWEHYVPLRDFDELQDVGPSDVFEYSQTSRKSNRSSAKATKQAEGRKSKPSHPIPQIVSMYSNSVVMAENNRAKQHFLNLVRYNRNRSEYSVDKVWYAYDSATEKYTDDGTTPSPILIRLQEACIALSKEADAVKREKLQNSVSSLIYDAKMSGENEELVDRIVGQALKSGIETYTLKTNAQATVLGETKAQQDEHYVYVYENGVKYRIRCTDPMLASAINGTNLLKLFSKQWMNNVGSSMNRWLSVNFTGKNPSFIPINFMRDVHYATLSHLVRKDGETARTAGNMARAARSIHRYMSGAAKPLTDDELNGYSLHRPNDVLHLIKEYGKDRVEDTLFKMYRIHGGETGWIHTDDTKMHAKRLRRYLQREMGTNPTLDKLKSAGGKYTALKAAGHLLDYAAYQSENMTRFATFLASWEKGKGFAEAASDAKNITVNFNRRGMWSSNANMFFVFFNATVQGADNFLDNIVRPNKLRFTVAASILFSASLLACALAVSAYGDGDDNPYWRLPEYIRHNCLVIPLFGLIGNEKFLFIPLPNSFRVINAWAIASVETYYGRKTPAQMAKSMLSTTFDNFSPVNASGGDLTRMVIPSFAVPFYDNWVNSDYAGRPVYREMYTPELRDNTPAHMQASRNVNEGLYAFARWWNRVGGGNDYVPAGVDPKTGKVDTFKKWIFGINPSRLEHVLTYYAGGRGQFFVDSYNTARPAWDKNAELEARNIPVVRRLYGGASDASYVSAFYERIDNLNRYNDILNKAKKLHDPDMIKLSLTYQDIQGMAIKGERYKKEIQDLSRKADAKGVNKDQRKRFLEQRKVMMRQFLDQTKQYDNPEENLAKR